MDLNEKFIHRENLKIKNNRIINYQIDKQCIKLFQRLENRSEII